MAFRCSNCNGNIVFDPESQMMQCQHCGTVLNPESFQVRDEANSSFICQNCGAELESTEDSYVGFCPYCGGQSVLYNGISDAGHPDGLLPFRVSKEQCQEIYTGYLKRIPCVPKALKEKGQVEKFVGVYTPWYAYHADIKTIRIPTKMVTKNTSRYTEYAHNMTEVGINGFYEGAPFDGSSYLDDDIAQGILPFNIKNERNYNPAFISGFYADAADVGESTYLTDAQDRMKNDVIAKVDGDILRKENLTKDFTSNDQVALEAGNTGFRKVMYPLWFLTYRTGDRLAYGVVNGDTGSIVSDIPVDMRSFWAMVGVAAVVLFALLELLVQPVAQLVTILSMIVSVAALYMIRLNYQKSATKDLHLNDKGYQAGRGEGNNLKKTKTAPKILGGILLLAVIGLGNMVLQDSGGRILEPENLRRLSIILGAACIVLSIILGLNIKKWADSIGDKTWVISVILVCVSLAVNVGISASTLASDLWYYIGAIVCMAGTFSALVNLIRSYNRSTTRPIPRLSDRQEV